MYSLSATTTMAVEDLPISPSQYKKAIRESVTRSGLNPKNIRLKALYEALTTVASFFEPGDVIEYRGGDFHVRDVID